MYFDDLERARDRVVVGIPDDHWGEAVRAAVERKPNMTIDAKALVAFVKSELGSVKAPKAIHIFASLPKSSVGKVLKNSVRGRIQRNTSINWIRRLLGDGSTARRE